MYKTHKVLSTTNLQVSKSSIECSGLLVSEKSEVWNMERLLLMYPDMGELASV